MDRAIPDQIEKRTPFVDEPTQEWDPFVDEPTGEWRPPWLQPPDAETTTPTPGWNLLLFAVATAVLALALAVASVVLLGVLRHVAPASHAGLAPPSWAGRGAASVTVT